MFLCERATLFDGEVQEAFVKDFHNKKMTKYSPLTGSFSVYDGNVESVIIGFTTEIPDESLAR